MGTYMLVQHYSFSSAHHLPHLGPTHKCATNHGHNWEVTVRVVAQKLHDEFVIDFAKLRQSMDTILQQLDHKDLNEILPFIPTCENLARYIHEQLSLIGKAQAEDRVQLFSVTIEEAKGNAVIYFSDTKEVVWRCPSIQEALTERN